MKIDRLVKKDESGNNVPDTEKFFTVQEKSKFYAGYAFELYSVSHRFVDKLATLENSEQLLSFDIPTMLSALTDGIVDADGKHLVDIKLAYNTNVDNKQWYFIYTTPESDYKYFYLDDYGATWTSYKK